MCMHGGEGKGNLGDVKTIPSICFINLGKIKIPPFSILISLPKKNETLHPLLMGTLFSGSGWGWLLSIICFVFVCV